MTDYFLSLPGGLTARFSTAADLFFDEQARLYLAAHVPGVKILDEALSETDLTISHRAAEKTRLVTDDASATFYSREPGTFSRDVCHLIYGMARRHQINQGLYPVHGACVGIGDRFALLVGPSGAGKTTLSQAMIDSRGAQLFSGNKTVVRFLPDGGIRAVAGTRTVTALDDNMKRSNFELDPAVYATAPEVDISAVAMIRLNPGVEETQQLARSVAVRALYPFFMDAVNADIIVGDYHVFNGNVSASAKRAANKGLREAFRTVPVFRDAGNREFLADTMTARLQGP